MQPRMVREAFLGLIMCRSKVGQSKVGGEGCMEMIPDRRKIPCEDQEVSFHGKSKL